MRCLSPRTVAFLGDGKTISWSPKHFSREYVPFKLPCSKCIECRLEYARQWAIRCVHEAQMHEENSFITLTYSDTYVPKRLEYKHYQDFMKRLRHETPNEVGYFVTGEYGEDKKRPHWHAIIFNYRPNDLEYKYSNDRGDKIYHSKILDELWGYGITEVGSVTMESAGYCARYAAKKLVHGKDDEHEYQPISKKSSKQAIGKKFLEHYWKDIFNYGHVVLSDGKTIGSIPRYYEKWLQKHQPAAWEEYVIKTKLRRSENAADKATKEAQETLKAIEKRWQNGKTGPIQDRASARKTLIENKFKQLQKHLKGDI